MEEEEYLGVPEVLEVEKTSGGKRRRRCRKTRKGRKSRRCSTKRRRSRR